MLTESEPVVKNQFNTNMCNSRPILLAVLCSFLFATCLASDNATSVPAGGINPAKIEVTLLPEKASIMLGEPSYVLLNVKNKSSGDLRLIVADTYQNDPGQSFCPLDGGCLLVRVKGKTGGDIALHPDYFGISFFLARKKFLPLAIT